MNDDQRSAASDRELFEAIVSQLEDPELTGLRQRFRALAAVLFLLGLAAVTFAGLGWAGVAGFCSAFAVGAVVAERASRRLLAPRRR